MRSHDAKRVAPEQSKNPCNAHIATALAIRRAALTVAPSARSWQQMMRARLVIDKTKAWADWADEEEEADAMILTLEAATEPRCMVNTVRGSQCPVWPEFAMTDFPKR